MPTVRKTITQLACLDKTGKPGDAGQLRCDCSGKPICGRCSSAVPASSAVPKIDCCGTPECKTFTTPTAEVFKWCSCADVIFLATLNSGEDLRWLGRACVFDTTPGSPFCYRLEIAPGTLGCFSGGNAGTIIIVGSLGNIYCVDIGVYLGIYCAGCLINVQHAVSIHLLSGGSDPCACSEGVKVADGGGDAGDESYVCLYSVSGSLDDGGFYSIDVDITQPCIDDLAEDCCSCVPVPISSALPVSSAVPVPISSALPVSSAVPEPVEDCADCAANCDGALTLAMGVDGIGGGGACAFLNGTYILNRNSACNWTGTNEFGAFGSLICTGGVWVIIVTIGGLAANSCSPCAMFCGPGDHPIGSGILAPASGGCTAGTWLIV